MSNTVSLPKSALTLSLLALALAPAAAEARPFSGEYWYDFMMNGQKVGYLRTLDKMDRLGGKAVHYAEREAVVKVRRLNHEMKMHHLARIWFAKDGTPLKLNYDSDDAGQKRTVRGVRKGDALVATLSLGGGRPQSVELPLAGGLRFASSVDALLLPKLKPGFEAQGKLLDEGQLNVQPSSLKVMGTKRLGGAKVFSVEEKMGPVITDSLIRAKDRVRLEAKIRGTGIAFTLRSKAEAEALSAQADVFTDSLLTLKRRLNRAKLKSLRLGLSSRSGDELSVISGAGQAVKQLSPTAVQVDLSRQEAPLKAEALPLKGKKLKAFLQPTPYEDLKDPAIQRQAARLKAEGGSLWGTAKAINRFVNQHIADKDLSKAYSTATEVLASKRGDCTEHSVLFSALAKAAGIPTRLVTGLVYVDGPKPVFGYHEWVEIWTGSSWLAMDPTFGQDLADPTHVRFAVGQSDAEGLRDAGLAAARIIGDLKLSVLAARER